MPEQLCELEWPRGWFGLATWQITQIVQVLEHDNGDRIFVAGGVLTDGTNLIGIVSERSKRQNVARLGPTTGWSIEERVDPRMPKHCRPIWRVVVESMIEGKNAAEAELGRPPGERPHEAHPNGHVRPKKEN